MLLVLTIEANELATDLVGEADLCPLKVFWLRVVVLLPGKLSVEAVSQPYKEEGDMISIPLVNTRLQHISAGIIPMHQSPRALNIWLSLFILTYSVSLLIISLSTSPIFPL